VAVETEELVLKSNVAAIAAKDAAALDKLLAAADKVNDATLSGNLDKQAQLRNVKATTAELAKQAGIEAKLASFDAERAKASADLAKQLKKLNDDATGKTAADAEKRAAKEAAALDKSKANEQKRVDGLEARLRKETAATAKAQAAEAKKEAAADERVKKQIAAGASAILKKQAAEEKASAAVAKRSAKEAADTDKRLKKDADAYDKHVRKTADAEYKTKQAASKKASADAAASLKTKAAEEKKAADESKAKSDAAMAGKIEGAIAVAKMALAAATVAAVIAIKVASVIIDETSFRESSTRALDRLTKGSGSATYDMAVNAAVKFGLDKATTVAQTKALLQAGIAKETIPLALKAIADVSVDLGEEKGNGLKEQLGKIARKNKFDTASVDGLAEAGVKAADVFEALKKKGESTTAVMARLKTNQVTAAEGIKAVLAAVEKSSGGAADATKSIPGLLNAISIRFFGLFDKIDTGPLKDVLKTVLELFEGAKGDALKKEVTDLGNALFNLLRPLSTAEGKKAIADTFDKAAKTAHDLAIVVGALERGIDKVGKGGGFTLLASALEELLRPLQTAADLITLINGGDASGGKSPAAPVAATFDTAAANDNGAADVGANMALGVSKGIDDNALTIGDSMVGAVDAAVKRAEALLGIASPAKRLVQTGKWSALGMAKGWNDNASAVADAASGTASMAAASAGGAAAMGGAGGNGGTPGAMPSISIQVIVEGGKGGEADAKAIAVALEPEVRQIVRRIQRDMSEQGGGPTSRVA
jgi:hypothetical protein